MKSDGSYIFLEINPNGEWVWLEDQLGFPISDRIARWLRHSLKTWLNKTVDWVWPRLTGKPVPSPDEQLMITATDEALLDEIENTVEKRTAQVDERMRTVETKLVALLTLTSVLSAAVTAGFAAASTMRIQKGFPLIPVWITLVLVFYIALMSSAISMGYGSWLNAS